MSRYYQVEALHPIPEDLFGDGITFTREDLQKYGHTLSNKPLSINHAGQPHRKFIAHPRTRHLPYPDNRTLQMAFDLRTDSIVGTIQLSDWEAARMVDRHDIDHLSVEHSRYIDGRLEFETLSLLTCDMKPRDPKTSLREALIRC